MVETSCFVLFLKGRHRQSAAKLIFKKVWLSIELLLNFIMKFYYCSILIIAFAFLNDRLL